MSEGLNRVTLIGNLGQDPELRHTNNGGAVLNLRIATTESYFDKESKERKEKTEWHTATMWGARGEALAKFLSKGSRIAVEGRLQTRSWEAKDGGKRYSTEVVATNIILLGGKGDGGKRSDSGGGGFDGPHEEGGDDGFGDDDIPF